MKNMTVLIMLFSSNAIYAQTDEEQRYLDQTVSVIEQHAVSQCEDVSHSQNLKSCYGFEFSQCVSVTKSIMERCLLDNNDFLNRDGVFYGNASLESTIESCIHINLVNLSVDAGLGYSTTCE